MKCVEGNILFNDALNTFCLRLYGVKQQGFFYMHHPTDRIAHTTAFVTPVVEYWLEREIAVCMYAWMHVCIYVCMYVCCFLVYLFICLFVQTFLDKVEYPIYFLFSLFIDVGQIRIDLMPCRMLLVRLINLYTHTLTKWVECVIKWNISFL